MGQTVAVRRRLLRSIPICAALVVGASCTSQEAAEVATPGVTLPPVAPTTTVDAAPADESAPPAEATTTVPTTTVADDAATTSTVPPTTAAPAPTGDPTSISTDVFAGGSADGWFFMGRWNGSEWEPVRDDTGTPDDPAVASGDEVTVVELDAAPLAGFVGSDAAVCTDDRLGPSISPSPGAPDNPGFGYRAVAFTADWNPQPRTVALVDAEVVQYADAGRAVFDGRVEAGDLDVASVKQIVVSDIDGDGDTEALVAFGGPSFSSLLLIDTDTRESTTIAESIDEAVPPTTDADGNDGSATTSGFSRFRTLAVADANGDGLMEIVVHSWLDDLATATVFTYDGSSTDDVLIATC